MATDTIDPRTQRLLDAARKLVEATDHYWRHDTEHAELKKALSEFDPPQPDVRQLAMESLVKAGWELKPAGEIRDGQEVARVGPWGRWDIVTTVKLELECYVFPEAKESQ